MCISNQKAIFIWHISWGMIRESDKHPSILFVNITALNIELGMDLSQDLTPEQFEATCEAPTEWIVPQDLTPEF